MIHTLIICLTILLITIIICVYKYKTNSLVSDARESKNFYEGKCKVLQDGLYEIVFNEEEAKKKIKALHDLYWNTKN